MPIHRLPGSPVRTRIETARASIKTIGGMDGNAYPGNLDFEILKKTRVRTAQQAKSSPGEVGCRVWFHAWCMSAEGAARKGGHGKSARRRVGKEYQKGWRCWDWGGR